VNPLGCLVDYLTPVNFIGSSLTPTDTSELIPKDISEFFERYKKALSKGN